MKAIVLFFALMAVVAFCDRQIRRWRPAGSNRSAPGAVVITYHDNAELIAQLQQLKAGQKFTMRPVNNGERVDTGVACADRAAVAAYEERMNRQLAEENRQIEAELRRITGENIRLQ
jgi:hypothetical protein